MSEQRRLPLTEHSAAPHRCPQPVRLEVLENLPLFADLNFAEIIDLEAQVRVHGYHAGDKIYQCGERATSLFFVASGTLKLYRPSVGGQDVVMHLLGPAEGFGTLGVLDQPTYRETAEAITDACVLKICTDDFEAILDRHPRTARMLLGEVLRRYEQAQETIHGLSVSNVRQRVAATLLNLADKLGEPQANAGALNLPLSRTDLAAMTGTTPETASRVVSRFRSDGIVDTGRHWTRILDRPRLEDAAGR